VKGVSRVAFRDPRQNHLCAEVENSSDRSIRSDLARAVVEAGWELHELRASAMSLEEIFLQLTREEPAAAPTEEAAPQETRP
jgi:gliding motility-associated transport system ATP-binding protein